MVKTRRSNGENGEAELDEGQDAPNDAASVSDEKASNWSQRELRSSQYQVKRKIQHWPKKYNRRLRTIKMPRIMFPESDTEPEKYSRRSRQVRVFFANDSVESPNLRIRRSRSTRNAGYMKDPDPEEDKPTDLQENVRRSCRKRKLLHHNFNESWITNELKVRGYPGLYGIAATSSSDEYFSGDEGRVKKLTRSHAPPITDEDTQSARQRRTSARFNNTSLKKERTETDSDAENNQTVIEKKPTKEQASEADEMETDEKPKEEANKEEQEEHTTQDSESNQTPARSTRTAKRNARLKLERDFPEESGSESSSDGSEVMLRPRRSNRTRKQPAFVEIAPRQTGNRRPTSYTIRKKPYSLRERKPIRRKTIRPQSPSSSSGSSSSSSDSEDLNVSMKNKTKGRQKSKSTDDKKTDRALREIQPIEVDGSVRFTSVGGLEDHIKCLREMVLFPLMYPDLFHKFKTRPAKGVLFHGPPGTGKTLLARALANECSIVGGRKVAFFMRKGADCLKKWVGESERHLKLLFQQANKMKPSIVFFDEIDALAPVRSVRQEQVHASVVGTLLAEMDGLCDRGEVVVIGATNRLDAVDPALRRAGRFDRELFFPPPHFAARRDILDIYTKDWAPKPKAETLDAVAQLTNGYGGSDLKALCSESVLKALRRVYPQVYDSEQALVIDTKKVEVTKSDMISAMHGLVAAGARASPIATRALPDHLVPLLSAQVSAAWDKLARCYIPLYERRPGDTPLSSQCMLITGPCANSRVAPALLPHLEKCAVRELSAAAVLSAHAYSNEQAIVSIFSECRRADRGCILLIRDISSLWSQLGASAGTLLVQLWRSGAAGENTLLLATSSFDYDMLPEEIQELFPKYKDCIYQMREPTSCEVADFLRPLITEEPLKPPEIESTEPPPPLPLAPPPPPPRESSVDRTRRKKQEDYKLRELRIFLRDICRKLASNRRFYKFTKPVDLEEVTDYLDIVKQPMDLETMMTKVDMHKYNCAKEFLDDIDLICANALEYNPDKTSSDKQIRHEACSLRDHAHALIDVEMDSDFELQCRDIARRRGVAPDPDLPDFIYTANMPEILRTTLTEEKSTSRTPHTGDKAECASKRKRRRKWSKGCVSKKAKTSQKVFPKDSSFITDEESKENKPITSTPLPNGEVTSCESGSDDDAPLRPKGGHIANGDVDTVAHAVLGSPTKSTDHRQTTPKASPKKRNSGHDVQHEDTEKEKVLINKTELDTLLYKNTKALRTIGLEALLDLHSQLSTVLHKYSKIYDRTKLPHEMQTIISRYVSNLAKK